MAFSRKQRCTCPSCHQKRTLLTAICVAEDVCFSAAGKRLAHRNQASVIWAMLPAISAEIKFAPVIAVKAQNQSAFNSFKSRKIKGNASQPMPIIC